MLIFAMLIVGALNIACFFIGARVGQSVANGEKISFPNLNPIELYKESKNQKEAEKENERLEKIMRNIDNYDGTSNGQKDV